MCRHVDLTVQAGTPMTVPGEVSLSPWLETGRLLFRFIWSKISILTCRLLHRLDRSALTTVRRRFDAFGCAVLA